MREKVWVCDDEASERFPVWTRGNAGEVYQEVASPLGWSAYGPPAMEPGHRDALCEMGLFTHDEFKQQGTGELAGCFGGYIYLNMSVSRVIAVRVPGMTPEAMDAAFFGGHPDVPPYRPDPRDVDPARTAAVSAWLARLAGSDPMLHAAEYAARVGAITAARPALDTLSDAALLAYFRSLKGEIRAQVKRHMTVTYGCNFVIGQIAVAAHAAGLGHLAAQVAAGVGDIDSARQSFELWDLSRMVRASPALTAEFDQGVQGLAARLRARADPATAGFLHGWDGFIRRWGFLGPNAWDLRAPTYAVNPEIPLGLLERTRLAPDDSAPSVRASALAAQREAAVEEIARHISGEGAVRARFLAAAGAVGRHLAARESSKVSCARTIEAMRAPIRTLGRRLVERGHLARWEHVVMVLDSEADAFIAAPAAHAGLIAARLARFELLQSREPPFVFEGEPPPLSAFRDRAAPGGGRSPAGALLGGIGVSPGRHTGKARVISTLQGEMALEPGEVIVARTTDASWSPLFLSAGAVIVETGSPISHAAIIAREIGIPAVVSVTGATAHLESGMRVTVDGDSGAVQVG